MNKDRKARVNRDRSKYGNRVNAGIVDVLIVMISQSGVS